MAPDDRATQTSETSCFVGPHQWGLLCFSWVSTSTTRLPLNWNPFVILVDAYAGPRRAPADPQATPMPIRRPPDWDERIEVDGHRVPRALAYLFTEDRARRPNGRRAPEPPQH